MKKLRGIGGEREGEKEGWRGWGKYVEIGEGDLEWGEGRGGRG